MQVKINGEIARSSVYFDGRSVGESSNWFWGLNVIVDGLGTFTIMPADRPLSKGTVRFLASKTFIISNTNDQIYRTIRWFGEPLFYLIDSLSNDLDCDPFDPSPNFDTRYLHKLLYNFYLISFQKLKALNHHIIIIFWNFWDFLRFWTFLELNLEYSTLIW